jgi:translation initiation factor 3 subunit L
MENEAFEEQLAEAAQGLEIPTSYRDDEFGDDDEFLAGRDEPGYEPIAEVSVPDAVRNFLKNFARNIQEKNVYELHYFYDNSFNKLTEKFYPKAPWPEPEAVAALVGDGMKRAVRLLYSDLSAYC